MVLSKVVRIMAQLFSHNIVLTTGEWEAKKHDIFLISFCLLQWASQTTENRQRQLKLLKCKRAIELYELIIRIVDIYYLVNGIRYITKEPQVYKAIFTCSSRRSFHSMWTSHDSIESYKDSVPTSQVWQYTVLQIWQCCGDTSCVLRSLSCELPISLQSSYIRDER